MGECGKENWWGRRQRNLPRMLWERQDIVLFLPLCLRWDKMSPSSGVLFYQRQTPVRHGRGHDATPGSLVSSEEVAPHALDAPVSPFWVVAPKCYSITKFSDNSWWYMSSQNHSQYTILYRSFLPSAPTLLHLSLSICLKLPFLMSAPGNTHTKHQSQTCAQLCPNIILRSLA